MSVPAKVLKIILAAVAKTLLGSWFSDASLVKEIGCEIVDMLKERIPDERERKNTEKKIEQIAKQIAAQMRPIFEHEAANLDSSSLEAIQLAIVDTLRRVDVTNELLMSQELDAVHLKNFFRSAYPEARLDFGRDEFALYDRMLAEVSQGIIETAPQLEGFPLLVAKKVVTLEKKVERQQEELRQEELEFEREYRNAIANKLDRMEVFGMPRRDELVSRQSLSVAHITLSGKQPISDELDLDAELLGRGLMQPIEPI